MGGSVKNNTLIKKLFSLLKRLEIYSTTANLNKVILLN
ncbi:hypothetical protein C8D70_104269 [Chryseobacterium sp. CBTAP 102]|nr:hypothetical protein C8D70_104269 [Chryseobacterium sp. CBTAP 102]